MDKLNGRNINISFTYNSNVPCYDNIIVLYAFDHGRVASNSKGRLGWVVGE